MARRAPAPRTAGNVRPDCHRYQCHPQNPWIMVSGGGGGENERLRPPTHPAVNPPNTEFHVSFFSLRFADAVFVNSKLAPKLAHSAIVPPNFVKMAKAPTFCLVVVFCTAATRVPMPVIKVVVRMVSAMVSLGSYIGVSLLG